MLDSFELEIQRLLVSGKPLVQVAEHLKMLWDRGGLSFYDQTVASLFLARSGACEVVLDLCSNAIQRETRIPWSAMSEVLSLDPSTMKKDIVTQMLTGCGLDGRLPEIAMAPKLDLMDSRFAKIRQEAWEERWAEIDREKKTKLAKIKEMHNERLHEVEEKLLTQIKRQFPKDDEVRGQLGELEERLARQKLEQKRGRGAKNEKVMDHLMHSRRRASVTSDETTLIGNSMVDDASVRPESAYDLSIALLQMELPEHALRALTWAPETAQRDWLKIEVLLETRRFIEALDDIHSAEQNYSHEAESSFAASYARARALWGIGKGREAVEILENIVALRPTYRSAHSLLMDWKEWL